jgi:hypothetical protein
MSRKYKPKDPALRGDGNHGAARPLRQSTEALVKAGIVQPAAEAADPKTPAPAREPLDDEAPGSSSARH